MRGRENAVSEKARTRRSPLSESSLGFASLTSMQAEQIFRKFTLLTAGL